jgi:hypothetical protein
MIQTLGIEPASHYAIFVGSWHEFQHPYLEAVQILLAVPIRQRTTRVSFVAKASAIHDEDGSSKPESQTAQSKRIIVRVL